MGAKVVTVTSGKGGVGKTTTTANIAAALADMGQKVVCIDGDIGLRNLDVVLGLENRIVDVIMSSFLDRLLGRQAKSADQAKERLKLVLIHDRTDITPAMMDSLKDELLQVISRYIEINPAAVNISMAQEGREQRLVADIPLKTARHRR